MKTLTFFISLIVCNLYSLTALDLSLEEQVGQLFIVGAYSNAEDAAKEEQYQHPARYVEEMIERFHIGGVLFKMRWNPEHLKAQTEHFQRLSSKPLFTCLDAEWGLSQRMEEGEVFPKNYALGMLGDLQLIYETGREIGRQCREIGINVNFSPVVDIDTNPLNPIINHRSFGSDPLYVAACGAAMMKGLQSSGVLACAKHFPGHGDTSVDSHTGLPIVQHSKQRLEQVEYVPFQWLIDEGVDLVMGAHLKIPAVDPELPASLSPAAVSEQLAGSMGFKGLIVTDDLIMGAVTKNYTLEKAVVLAFLAGNDLILLSRDIEKGVRALLDAAQKGVIKKEEIARRAQKILSYKDRLRSQENLPVLPSFHLRERLYGTLVKVTRGERPLGSPEVVLQIGGRGDSAWFQSGYACHFFSADSTEKERESVLIHVQPFQHIAVAIFEMQPTNRTGYGIQAGTQALIQQLLDAGKTVTVILHGDPRAAELIPEKAVVIGACDASTEAQKASIAKF